MQMFSFKHKPNMSRGTLKCILKISIIQLKAMLNAVYKVLDNVCEFLLVDWRPKWRGMHCFIIFTSNMSFKLLTDLKIWHLFGNGLKLNFLLHLAWPRLFKKNADRRLSFIIYLFTKNLLLYCPSLVKFIKMVTIFLQ